MPAFPGTGSTNGRTGESRTMRPPLLSVRDLGVRYHLSDGGRLAALQDVTFDLGRGEVLGIVGETGSGKTTLALTLMGLLPEVTVEGEIEFDREVLPVSEENAMRRYRWRRISLAFQTAGTSFDPVYRMEDQIIEPLTERLGLGFTEARERAKAWWAHVGLPVDRIDHYPHQLSGGEKQRAMLAMALACEPDLLILDEPTSGLDAFTRVAILDLLRRIHQEQHLSMILISHQLDDVTRLSDRTLVLYAGQIAELGATSAVLPDPRHPYTWGLVNAYPTMMRSKDLWGIRGDPPDPMSLPLGCPFAPRCTQAIERCHDEKPALEEHDGRMLACHLGGLQVLLEAREMSRSFKGHGSQPVNAVRDVSLRLREGEVVALVGQTGSGKTTLAKLMVGLLEPDKGMIVLRGQSLSDLQGADLKAIRQQIQLIFQDPFDAVSPRLTVLEIVREPLDIQGIGERNERDELARRVIGDVRLPTGDAFLGKRGHELSGGQLQRVAIARALVLRPKVIIADEPVSMLDPSEQARVIRLLKDLQNEYGTGMLLISHDLALVRKVADRIVVLKDGEVVEAGLAEHVVTEPRAAYTRQLLSATDGALNDSDPESEEEYEDAVNHRI